MIALDDEINAGWHQRASDVAKKQVPVHFRGYQDKIRQDWLHQHRKDIAAKKYAAVRYLEFKFATAVNHTNRPRLD